MKPFRFHFVLPLILLISCTTFQAKRPQETRVSETVAEQGVSYNAEPILPPEALVLFSKRSITEHTLKNGLNVLVLETHRSPVVSMQLWYKVGSSYETSLRGISHLFEHLMIASGSIGLEPWQYADEVAAYGGVFTAFTYDDMTVYSAKIPAGREESVFKLWADQMFNFVLDEEVLEREKAVVKEEYHLRVENDINGRLFHKARKLLFPDHPYEFGPMGTLEDVERISAEDCLRFYRQFYHPSNAVLVVVGDVNTAETIRQIDTHFNRASEPVTVEQPDFTPLGVRFKRYHTDTTRLPVPVTLVTVYLPESGHPDFLPLIFIYEALLYDRDSALWHTLKEENVVLNEVSGILSGKETGAMFFSAVHYPHLSQSIEKVVLDELDRIQKDGIPKHQFDKIRRRMLTRALFSQYSSAELAFTIGHTEVMKGDYSLFYQNLTNSEQLRNSDIIRVAKTYFNEQNISVIRFEPEDVNPFAWIRGLIKSIF